MKAIRIFSVALTAVLFLCVLAPVSYATATHENRYNAPQLLASENDRSRELKAILVYIQGYDTEQEWGESYDFLRPYVDLATSIIDSGAYDADYADLQSLLVDFRLVQAYFANRLLSEHIEYLEAEIERYESSSHYFEKYGIALGIRDYITQNELDTSSLEISAIIAKNNQNLQALSLDEEKYDQILVDNAYAFLDACNDLKSKEKYSDLVALFNEAGKYLYDMDVSVEGVREGIEALDKCRAKIETIREQSQELIRLSLLLTTSDGNDFLPLVLELTPYIEKADETVAGVSDAIATYYSELDAYDESIEQTNDEITFTFKTALYLSNTKKSRRPITYLLENID